MFEPFYYEVAVQHFSNNTTRIHSVFGSDEDKMLEDHWDRVTLVQRNIETEFHQACSYDFRKFDPDWVSNILVLTKLIVKMLNT